MTAHARPRPPLWWLLPAYLAAGACAGLLPVQVMAVKLNYRPGMGTMVAVNLLLPIAAMGLAAWHRRIGAAWLGAPLMVAGFFLARLLIIEPQFWHWTPALIAQGTHPVVVAAGIFSAVFSTALIVVLRAARARDTIPRCPACGYERRPEGPSRCPECGVNA